MARNFYRADRRFFPRKYNPNISQQGSLENVFQKALVIIPLLPKGGDKNDVLIKSTNADYDVEWFDINNLIGNLVNIYNADGSLNSDRILNGTSNFSLEFKELFNFILEISNNFFLKYVVGNYQVGSYLTPINITTNETVWRLPNNGLSVNTNGNIQLGGDLIQDTEIDADSNNLSILQVDAFTLTSLETILNSATLVEITSNEVNIKGNNLITLQTPSIINSTASNGQVLALKNSSSGEVEYEDIKYIESFLTTDWVFNEITITSTVHNKGLNPIIQVYRDLGGNNFILETPSSTNNLLQIGVDNLGNILITSNTDFNGKIIII